jgi:Uma2 family endonuclease
MAATTAETTRTEAVAPGATPPTTKRYTLSDLEHVVQPWDDTRYEIIAGELFVSTQPSIKHQYTAHKVELSLGTWVEQGGTGMVLPAPGLIFAEDDNVAPDVVWLSLERLRAVRWDDDKLHGPPELVVEILSPGPKNERRDRDVKPRLYSRRGVDEYWILDPQLRRAEVYRRDPDDPATLRLAAALGQDDALESPLLPGFRVRVGDLFFPEQI